MASFFKTFAHGVLYVITLPLILAFWALYAIYCVIIFIYMSFRNVIIFFSGGTPNGDMKEDVEAKRILLERMQRRETTSNVYISPNSQAIYNEPAPYQEQPLPEDPYDSQDVSIEEDNKDDYVG